MQSYDDYLANQVEEQMKECEPEQIEPSSEHHSGAYNCQYCDCTECEFWSEFNDE